MNDDVYDWDIDLMIKYVSDISMAAIRGGDRADVLTRARKFWGELPHESREIVIEEFELCEMEPRDFYDLAAAVSGFSPRTVRRHVEVWGRLSPEVQSAWRWGRITQQMAIRLAALDHEEQVALLPSMVGRQWPELPAWIKDKLRGGTGEPAYLRASE